MTETADTDNPRVDDEAGEERVDELQEEVESLRADKQEVEEELRSVSAKKNRCEQELDRVKRENEKMKKSPLFVATVEDITEGGIIVKQHGNNQEALTEVTEEFEADLEPGDRVAVNNSFAVAEKLEQDTDVRAKAMQVEQSPEVTYSDIGGVDEQLREVRETVELPLESPGQFEEVGIDPPSGVLLHGPPGTGKTMLAKAVANQTDATFIKMAGSELVHKFIGEGPRMVRDLFEVARKNSPAVIFIDEIDAVAAERTDSKTSGDAEVQRTLMQLLSEMDGFEDRGDIRIIAATNRYDMLDEAILRPGRFDRRIEVPEPGADGREQIFEIHTEGMNVADDVDYSELAAEAEGLTGAEIEAICTEAGMFAIRSGRIEVTAEDFWDACEKATSGENEESALEVKSARTAFA